MNSALVVCLLVVAEVAFVHGQVLTITAGTAAAAAAAAGLGAAALGGLGLLAVAGSRRRGGRRRGGGRRHGRRYGRDVSSQINEVDAVTLELLDAAATADDSECAQKLVCLLWSAESLSELESDILTAVQSPTHTAAFSVAMATAGRRGTAGCAAAYRRCPQTRAQLTQLAEDVAMATAAQSDEA